MSPAQVLDHFDRIRDSPDVSARLRRFILDLAVRGKLVEQDPNDEPASDLPKRIRVEKARLVDARSARKETPFPLITPADMPFGVPTGWNWVRVRQVTSDRGQTIPDKDFTYIDVTAINKEAGSVDPELLFGKLHGLSQSLHRETMFHTKARRTCASIRFENETGLR